MTVALVLALAVLLYGVLAGPVGRADLTAPLLFTGAGLLLGPQVLGVITLDVDDEVLRLLAEATLAVVLFTDASRMDLQTVGRQHRLPVRMLVLGLPLAILIGAATGSLLLPSLGLAAVGLLGALLAPTDAALGQAVMTDRAVPVRIRQTLNVESGLNDGLAVPFVTILLDIVAGDAGGVLGYVGLAAQLVGVGVVAGLLAGLVGGRLIVWSVQRSWATESAQRIATLALAGVAYTVSESLGGNGFVAAFVAGLAAGTAARSLLNRTTPFTEAEGELLSLITFLLFGATLVGEVLGDLGWQTVVYAVLSLVVVRPVAIALSLLGTHLRPPTVLFLGWFGPRGLATIVFTLLVAEADVPGGDVVTQVATLTVVLSIVAHGLSARPLAKAYGRRMERHDGAPEMDDIAELPMQPGSAPRPEHGRSS